VAPHAQGILHRHIKPSNVLVERRSDGSFQAILCDLGISAVLGSEHTRTVGVMGTLGYMAPERHQGSEATAASDVYALGCLLWACLTGRPPYTGPDVQVALGHLNGALPQLPGADPLTAAINDVLRRSLAKDPADRYPSAQAAERALREALGPQQATVDPGATVVPPPPPRTMGATPAGSTPVDPAPFAQTAPDAGSLGGSPVDAVGAGTAQPLPQPTALRHPRPPAPEASPAPLPSPVPPPGMRPHRRRGLAIGAVAAAALLLVAALATGGWAYATGRLGFGPLSSQDKAAVAAVNKAKAPGSAWSAAELSCAGEKFLHQHRARSLLKAGVLTEKGGTLTVTSKWTADDTTDYLGDLFACSSHWAQKLADDWGVSSSDCLTQLGPVTMASYLGHRSRAVEARLDSCYQVPGTVPTPSVTAKPAYRAVALHIAAAPHVANADTTVEMLLGGNWQPMDPQTFDTPTSEGGVSGCSQFRTKAAVGWHSAPLYSKSITVCGHAKPKRLWWTKAATCTWKPGCTKWYVQASGLAANTSYPISFEQNGGSCSNNPKDCHGTIETDVDGRYSRGWSWSFSAGYHETFTATVGKLTAAIPF